MATILPDELKQIVSVLDSAAQAEFLNAQIGVDITFTDVNGDFLSRAEIAFVSQGANEWRLYTSENEEEN